MRPRATATVDCVHGERVPPNGRSGPEVPSVHRDMKPAKTACCAVAARGSKLLAVLSPDRGWVLPGGGLEKGESLPDCARRELWEETGILAGEMAHVCSGTSEGTICHAFLVLNWTGRLRASPEGRPAWVDPALVLRGRYGRYAAEVFARIDAFSA